jgi:Amt family ammonium transporter
LVVEKTVGFRINQQGEIEGLDKSLHGESGYGMTDH